MHAFLPLAVRCWCPGRLHCSSCHVCRVRCHARSKLLALAAVRRRQQPRCFIPIRGCMLIVKLVLPHTHCQSGLCGRAACAALASCLRPGSLRTVGAACPTPTPACMNYSFDVLPFGVLPSMTCRATPDGMMVPRLRALPFAVAT